MRRGERSYSISVSGEQFLTARHAGKIKQLPWNIDQPQPAVFLSGQIPCLDQHHQTGGVGATHPGQ